METDFALMQKGRIMFKVPNGQDPYSVIGKYIRDHITAIEDIIAVIKIDDITTNQLFMADMNEENYFIWDNDWYEGEKDVVLIDFFPVSEAINPSAQPVAKDINVPINDCISRQVAIDALAKNMPSLTTPDGCGEFDHDIQVTDEAYVDCMQIIHELPSAQPEIVRCKDCEYGEQDKAEEPKRCDTCRHEKSQWFNRCADCSDYELWEGKEE